MCDFGVGETAAAIGIAGVAASVAGAGVAAYSAYSQTEAANNASKYNAEVAANEATQANQLGTVEAEQHDLQVKALIGEQTAGYAGGGVEVNSGSALTQTTQTAGYGALDSLAIKQNRTNQAIALQNQEQLDQSKEVNPFGTASTSLLSSASSIGSSLSTAQRAGAF